MTREEIDEMKAQEIKESKAFYYKYCSPCSNNVWSGCYKTCTHRKELTK